MKLQQTVTGNAYATGKFSCHRCGKAVRRQGKSNVLARHAPPEGYPAYDGVCPGAGENPCTAGHQHPCRPW